VYACVNSVSGIGTCVFGSSFIAHKVQIFNFMHVVATNV
jgi:hypothetical protein